MPPGSTTNCNIASLTPTLTPTEGLSEHTAPFDALVYVPEGEAEVVISGEPYRLRGGETVIMPANDPHALKAITRFEMILTMIRS